MIRKAVILVGDVPADARRQRDGMMPLLGGRQSLLPWIAGAGLLAVAVAVLAGSFQDYAAYVIEWHRLHVGADPYAGDPVNAYGPLFNLLAAVSLLHPLAPKLLFVMIWLGVIVWLVGRAARTATERSAPPWLVAAFLLGPWFWIEIPGMGHFDVMVAALCLVAVHLAERDRLDGAAALLAAAFLLKLLPILLLPVLALGSASSARRTRAVAVFATVAVVGFGLAYLAWGSSAFTPFVFGDGRPSSGFSVWRALRGDTAVLGPLVGLHNLDGLSAPILLLSVGATAAFLERTRASVAASALLLGVVSLAFLKLGHSQFFTTPAFLAAYFAIDRWRSLDARLRIALAVYFAWLTLHAVMYAASGGLVSPAWAGWVHFAASGFLVVELGRHIAEACRARQVSFGAGVRGGILLVREARPLQPVPVVVRARREGEILLHAANWHHSSGAVVPHDMPSRPEIP